MQLSPTKQSKLNRAWAGLWCVARQSYSDMYNVRIQPPTQPRSLSVAHHCRCHAARHGSDVCTSTEQRINQAWHEHRQAETAPKIYMTGLSSSLPEDRGESNAPAAILQQRHTDLRSRHPFTDVTLILRTSLPAGSKTLLHTQHATGQQVKGNNPEQSS